VAAREARDLRNHGEPELLVEAGRLKAVGGENELVREFVICVHSRFLVFIAAVHHSCATAAKVSW
jgi:hypothetical protein